MIENNDSEKYNDIINLPYPMSTKHKRMSMSNRAAQFAPFSVLAGYESEILETARLTENKIELSEDKKDLLNYRLNVINENLKNKPIISVTYFVADKKKNGGKYIKQTGVVKCIDDYEQKLIMENDVVVYFNDILDITSD